MTYTTIYFRPYGTDEVLSSTLNFDVAKEVFTNFCNNYPAHIKYVRLFADDEDITDEILKTLVLRRHLI